MNPKIIRIAETILDGGRASRSDAAFLAELSRTEVYDLLYWANRLRERFCGDEVHLCSIVNARSGACPEDCIFCSQSAHHRTGVPVYPMIETDRIVAAGREASQLGAGHFGIVTSGPAPGGGGDLASVCHAARELSELGDAGVCV